MAAYVQDSNFLTRRSIVFVLIVALHVFLAWALATGLARKVVEMVAPPIQADVVQEETKRDEPPPPPPPQLERPPVEVPPPDVNIQLPVENTSNAIRDVTDKPVVRPPPPVARAVAKVKGHIDPKKFPNSADYYPPASQRLGETGVSTVHACYDASGRLTSEPTARGAGQRLDEAAVKMAKAYSGKYPPSTEDGKPVSDCTDFSIRWVLK